MDKCVVLSVGSSGRANWTADQDYVLTSVTWAGQGATSFGSLSTDEVNDSNLLGSGARTQEKFILSFTGNVGVHCSQLDLQVVKGTVLSLEALAGGINISAILSII